MVKINVHKFFKETGSISRDAKHPTSRSEGKRLLENIEDGSEVLLDFKEIINTFPAFTDEVFKVLAKEKKLTIYCKNVNKKVMKMVKWSARKN